VNAGRPALETDAMTRRSFGALAAPLLALAAGCGPRVAPQDTQAGSFGIIEGAVEDLCTRIEDPKFRPSRDQGTDTDRIGMALNMFKKSVEGTSLAADAVEIEKKVFALEKLGSTRAPLETRRAAAKDLRDFIAAAKAKQ
jgi:hypothetical protein